MRVLLRIVHVCFRAELRNRYASVQACSTMRMQSVINIAALRVRGRDLPCILRGLIQLYRLSTTTTNTPNEIRSE